MSLGVHTGPFAKMAGLMGAVAALVLGPLPLAAQDVDISNTQRLMFVADAVDPVIDVIDLIENEVVFRIETEERVDDMVATPFAPVLIYTNLEKRLVSMYDLRNKTVAKQVELPIAPRHMVLDTTGSKIGFSDSEDGAGLCCSRLTADRSCSPWKTCRPRPTCSSIPTRWISGTATAGTGPSG